MSHAGSIHRRSEFLWPYRLMPLPEEALSRLIAPTPSLHSAGEPRPA